MADANPSIPHNAHSTTAGSNDAHATAKEAAAETLRRSEERYRALVQATSQAVWTADTSGQSAESLAWWEATTGQTTEESHGWGWLDALHAEDRNHAQQAWLRSLTALTPFDVEYRIRTRQGEYRNFAVRGIPILEADGRLREWIGTLTDVTESRRAHEALAESEARFRALADNMGQLAWMADSDGYRFWYNRRWFDYTGTTPEQMQGWGWNQVHHPNHAGRLMAKIAEHVRTGLAWEDTFPLRGRDGTYRWFLTQAYPIFDESGKVLRWFGTSTDVTEQREALEAIQLLNTRMKRAMAETHHRVRNSLQVLIAILDTMSPANVGPTLSTEKVTLLSRYVRTLGAIHDLLTEQAKIEGDARALSATDLLHRLLSLLQQVAGKRQLQYAVEDAILPTRAATALALITNTLVSNAIQYSQSSVEVRFTVDGETGTLEVLDDGPGIPADFDPSSEVHTGLELVSNLVGWDLGGTLRLENRAEGGARAIVTFAIPATAPDET